MSSLLARGNEEMTSLLLYIINIVLARIARRRHRKLAAVHLHFGGVTLPARSKNNVYIIIYGNLGNMLRANKYYALIRRRK